MQAKSSLKRQSINLFVFFAFQDSEIQFMQIMQIRSVNQSDFLMRKHSLFI